MESSAASFTVVIVLNTGYLEDTIIDSRENVHMRLMVGDLELNLGVAMVASGVHDVSLLSLLVAGRRWLWYGSTPGHRGREGNR